jgi:hypothetical protein
MITACSSPGQGGRAVQVKTSATLPVQRYWNAVPNGMSIVTPGMSRGDALAAVRSATPDLALAQEDVPVLLYGPEMAGAADHTRRNGRVDHVSVRPIHQEADMSS